MYALVEIKGKQYKAEKGAVLQVDLMDAEKGTEMEFDTVLLTSKDDKVKVGTPFVKGAKVKAVLEDHVKGDKIRVIKYKRRKGYMRTQGHRQKYSILKVNEVLGA